MVGAGRDRLRGGIAARSYRQAGEKRAAGLAGRGKTDAMMPDSRDLGCLLREQAARFGAHPAVIGGGETIGYATLAGRAARIASFLTARGIRRGDRIGLLMNNRPEWLETFFGAAMAGAVTGAFSTWSKREELAYLIETSAIRLLGTLHPFTRQNFPTHLPAIAPPHA